MNGESVRRFGYHTKRFRKKEGWTQEELARKSKRGRRIIVWVETAHKGYFPDLSTVEAIAQGLGRDVAEFFKPIPDGEKENE